MLIVLFTLADNEYNKLCTNMIIHSSMYMNGVWDVTINLVCWHIHRNVAQAAMWVRSEVRVGVSVGQRLEWGWVSEIRVGVGVGQRLEWE